MDVVAHTLLGAALLGGLRLFVSALHRDEVRRPTRLQWTDDEADRVAWARRQAIERQRGRMEGMYEQFRGGPPDRVRRQGA
jgi:hypothetical protein